MRQTNKALFVFLLLQTLFVWPALSASCIGDDQIGYFRFIIEKDVQDKAFAISCALPSVQIQLENTTLFCPKQCLNQSKECINQLFQTEKVKSLFLQNNSPIPASQALEFFSCDYASSCQQTLNPSPTHFSLCDAPQPQQQSAATSAPTTSQQSPTPTESAFTITIKKQPIDVGLKEKVLQAEIISPKNFSSHQLTNTTTQQTPQEQDTQQSLLVWSAILSSLQDIQEFLSYYLSLYSNTQQQSQQINQQEQQNQQTNTQNQPRSNQNPAPGYQITSQDLLETPSDSAPEASAGTPAAHPLPTNNSASAQTNSNSTSTQTGPIVAFMGNLTQSLGSFFDALWNGAKQIASAAWNTVKKAAKKTAQAFASLFDFQQEVSQTNPLDSLQEKDHSLLSYNQKLQSNSSEKQNQLQESNPHTEKQIQTNQSTSSTSSLEQTQQNANQQTQKETRQSLLQKIWNMIKTFLKALAELIR